MNYRTLRTALSASVAVAASLWLGGCVVRSQTPMVYGNYGYTTAAAPNTVYYRGGYHSGVYYRPGYYVRNAPFISATVAAPTYVQPGYVQPGYVQGGYVQGGYVQGGYAAPQGVVVQQQQPVYYQQRPGVVVGGSVQTPYVGGSVIVR